MMANILAAAEAATVTNNAKVEAEAVRAETEQIRQAMNDYRTSIQDDCALNLQREAFNELRQLGWPHKATAGAVKK